jgi:hypothetical protein
VCVRACVRACMGVSESGRERVCVCVCTCVYGVLISGAASLCPSASVPLTQIHIYCGIIARARSRPHKREAHTHTHTHTHAVERRQCPTQQPKRRLIAAASVSPTLQTTNSAPKVKAMALDSLSRISGGGGGSKTARRAGESGSSSRCGGVRGLSTSRFGTPSSSTFSRLIHTSPGLMVSQIVMSPVEVIYWN